MCEIIDFIALAIFAVWYNKKRKEQVDDNVTHTPVMPLVEAEEVKH